MGTLFVAPCVPPAAEPCCGPGIAQPPGPTGASDSPSPEPPPPPLVLPSDKAVRKAARLVWSDWVHSSIWHLFFGAVILLAALGLMILVLLLALRMNDDRVKEGRTKATPDGATERVAWR